MRRRIVLTLAEIEALSEAAGFRLAGEMDEDNDDTTDRCDGWETPTRETLERAHSKLSEMAARRRKRDTSH